MLDTRQIYSMSDFLRNHKAHVARLKETRIPEALTVNGRAEVVMMDTESYENPLERLHNMEAISSVRAIIRAANNSWTDMQVTESELERSQEVMRELLEETEQPGLYR